MPNFRALLYVNSEFGSNPIKARRGTLEALANFEPSQL